MADVELLPCPFCGGKATLTITGNVRSTRKCMVKCEGCRYQRIDAALRYGDDWLRATAIAAWNRRTTTAEGANIAPLQAENERLRVEVEGLRAERMVVIENHAYWKARADRLAEALRGLMAWQVRNVEVWHNPAYDDAHRALAALAQEDRNG